MFETIKNAFKVKEIRVEFLNVYTKDEIVVPYANRQIEITGIRFK